LHEKGKYKSRKELVVVLEANRFSQKIHPEVCFTRVLRKWTLRINTKVWVQKYTGHKMFAIFYALFSAISVDIKLLCNAFDGFGPFLAFQHSNLTIFGIFLKWIVLPFTILHFYDSLFADINTRICGEHWQINNV
jgi:hypothetical protein